MIYLTENRKLVNHLFNILIHFKFIIELKNLGFLNSAIDKKMNLKLKIIRIINNYFS